jgi:hypothetical protein
MSNLVLIKMKHEQNVIWNPRVIKTTHPPQFLKDETVSLKYLKMAKKFIRPGGILISGSFTVKYIP